MNQEQLSTMTYRAAASLTAQQAIELSIAENRTVSIPEPTEDDYATLMLECEDGEGCDWWGTTEDGQTWRVSAG